jgi:hypothetical protein
MIPVGNVTTCRIVLASARCTLYLAVSSVNSLGIEGPLSSELILDRTPPTISGPAEITTAAAETVSRGLPDLRRMLRFDDDITASEDLVVIQHPAPGSAVDANPVPVTFIAFDEAGNTERGFLWLHVNEDDGDPVPDESHALPAAAAMPQPLVRWVNSGAGSFLRVYVPVAPDQDRATLRLSVETAVSLRSAWRPVPGLERVPVPADVLTLDVPVTGDRGYFRARLHAVD